MSELIFYYSLHQKLWNILADNPGMNKDEALEKYFTEEEREKFGYLMCTACEYGIEMASGDISSRCNHCPLDVSHVLEDYPELKIIGLNHCLNGSFVAWRTALDMYYAYRTCTDTVIYCRNYNSAKLLFRFFQDDLTDKENFEKLCSKYARAIANLKPKEGIKYI